MRGESLSRCPWLRACSRRPAPRAARLMSSVAFDFEQLGVREDDPELVVQAMEEETQFGRFVHRSPRQELLDAERARRITPGSGLLPATPPAPAGRSVLFGVAPQRVDEDPHRTAGGAHVFDLAAREPVVDRATADADELTGLHDRNSFSFHLAVCLRGFYRRVSVRGLGTGGALTNLSSSRI